MRIPYSDFPLFLLLRSVARRELTLRELCLGRRATRPTYGRTVSHCCVVREGPLRVPYEEKKKNVCWIMYAIWSFLPAFTSSPCRVTSRSP